MLLKISKKKEYDNIFLKGRSSFGTLLGIKTAKNHTTENRIGIIVGTKISKKAVERNLIKRRIREILRSLNNEFKPGNDLVIVTLPLILGKNFEQVKQEIEKNLTRLKILIKRS